MSAALSELLLEETTAWRWPNELLLFAFKLPPLEDLPSIVSETSVHVEVEEPEGDGEIQRGWAEIPFDTEEEARGHAREVLAGRSLYEDPAKVTRHKWIVRQLPGEPAADTFGLPVVQLRHVQWSIEVERGERKWWNWPAHLVPAAATESFFWRKYGLNLAILRAYEDVPGRPRVSLATPGSSKEAMAYFGLRGRGVPLYAPILGTTGRLPRGGTYPKTAAYYRLNDVALLVGHLERQLLAFIHGKDPSKLSPRHPALPGAAIRFSDPTKPEDAKVLFFDEAEMTPSREVLLPGGLRGEPLETLQKLFRLREDIHRAQGDLATLRMRGWDIRQAFWRDPWAATAQDEDSDGKAAAAAFQHQAQELAAKRRELHAGIASKAAEARALYLELLKVLEKRQEAIHAVHRQLVQVRGELQERRETLATVRPNFTKMAAHVRACLPHMSVLPAGIDAPILLPHQGPEAGAVMRVSRLVYGGAARQLEFSLYPEDEGLPDLFRVANAVFGELKLNWLFPLGYVGLCKLYEQAGAYDTREDLETAATDFWCTIRPDAAERIRKKGLEDWWSRNSSKPARAADLFTYLIAFMTRLNLPFSTKEDGREVSDAIYGLIQRSRIAQGPRGTKAYWRFNPQLESFVTGEGRPTPQFMAVDSRAMFSYSGKELHLGPALQLYLEHLIRVNFYKGAYQAQGGALLTPQGDGISFGTLAERLGLPAKVRPSDNIGRLEMALDTVARTGAIKDWKVQGRQRSNPYETKIKIVGGGNYQAVYGLAGLEHDETKLLRQLEAPFAPERRRSRPEGR